MRTTPSTVRRYQVLVQYGTIRDLFTLNATSEQDAIQQAPHVVYESTGIRDFRIVKVKEQS